MLLGTVDYGGTEPVAVVITNRARDNISTIRLAKDITETEHQMEDTTYNSWSATEAYMEIATDQCPTISDITSDFNTWWDTAIEFNYPIVQTMEEKVANLIEQNIALQAENVATMVALTEVYEMMLGG